MTDKHHTIDLHTHILPKNWPNLRERYGCDGWVELEHHKPCCAKMIVDGEEFREIQSNCWDPKVRLSDCDRDGVDMQVLSTVPIMYSYWAEPQHALDLASILNDHIADVIREWPDRFAGLATIPMQNTKMAIRELERVTKDLGLSGVGIGTHVNGKNLDDPSIVEILEAAEALDVSVFVHPWDMLARERMPDYWLPWLVGMPTETTLAISSMIFGGVFDRLPRLKVAFAHGGGSFPFTLGRIDHGFHARPDLCATKIERKPSEYIDSFYLDSLVHDADAMNYLVNLHGADRIAMGSDYPFPLGEQTPGALVRSMDSLSEQQKKLILGETAARFLGMRREPCGCSPGSTTPQKSRK